MPRRALPANVTQLGDALAGRLDDIVDRLTARITTEIPPYRLGVVDADEVRSAVHANIAMIIDTLRGSERSDLSAPRETGRLRSEAGAPLPELLHAYRIGFAELWRVLVEEARAAGSTAYDALIDAATHIWSLADEYSIAVTDAYRDADASRVVASAKERAALIDAVLTGDVDDSDTLWDIAGRLRLPFEGVFVVVAAETAALGEDPIADAESRLAARDIASGWRLMAGVAAGLVSCGKPARVALAVEIIGDLARTRVGVSPAFERLSDAPDNYRYARTAMASLPPNTVEVRQFAATPLAVLAAGNPDTSRQVARTVLGEILDLPATERDTFLETLRAWLDALGSARDAGRAIFVHPNTIRHRLRRVEQYTGRDLDKPQDVAEIAVALQAVRLFPDLAP